MGLLRGYSLGTVLHEFVEFKIVCRIVLIRCVRPSSQTEIKILLNIQFLYGSKVKVKELVKSMLLGNTSIYILYMPPLVLRNSLCILVCQYPSIRLEFLCTRFQGNASMYFHQTYIKCTTYYEVLGLSRFWRSKVKVTG